MVIGSRLFHLHTIWQRLYVLSLMIYTVIEWNWGAEGSHFMFMLMIQVIYAGVVFGSGGADLTIWLLFGFVVSSSLHSQDVSFCPHCGFPYVLRELKVCVMCWMQVSNLIFAAAETHRWYLQKFDNYPSNRVVIIPFVCWNFKEHVSHCCM
jgi:hypothetical protein